MDDVLKKVFVVTTALAVWGFLSFVSHGPINMGRFNTTHVFQTNQTNTPTVSLHDSGHENSWIQDMDKEKGLVLVTTIDTKMAIVFKPAAGDLKKFRVGYLAPVTFQCTKLKKGKCDFKAPYKLFVSNGLVDVDQLILPKK